MENREGYKKTELGWIPESWEVKQLDNLKSDEENSFIDGDWIETPYITSSGIRLIQTSNIGIGKFIDKNKKYISEISFKELKCKEVKNQDILICRLAEPIGRSCIVPNLSTKNITAVDVTIFRPNTFMVCRNYINYYLNSEKALNVVKKLSGGSTRQRINRTNLAKTKLPLPPLPEQQKIASILTTVDDKISSIEAQIQQTEQLKKGLMAKLLTEGIGHTEFKDTEIGRIPKCWEVDKLKTISDIKRGLASHQITYSDSGVRLIRINDFKNKEHTLIQVTKETKRLSLIENDILIAGTGATAGITHFVDIEWEGLPFSYNVPRIRTKKLNPKFLFFALNAKSIIRQQLSLFTGNAQHFLDTRAIGNLLIPLPPLPEQQQIASILSSVDDKIDILQSKKSAYTTLKKGLMAKLLTGQMRVRI